MNECSRPCSGGYQRFERIGNGANHCATQNTTRICNLQPCPSTAALQGETRIHFGSPTIAQLVQIRDLIEAVISALQQLLQPSGRRQLQAHTGGVSKVMVQNATRVDARVNVYFTLYTGSDAGADIVTSTLRDGTKATEFSRALQRTVYNSTGVAPSTVQPPNDFDIQRIEPPKAPSSGDSHGRSAGVVVAVVLAVLAVLGVAGVLFWQKRSGSQRRESLTSKRLHARTHSTINPILASPGAGAGRQVDIEMFVHPVRVHNTDTP